MDLESYLVITVKEVVYCRTCFQGILCLQLLPADLVIIAKLGTFYRSNYRFYRSNRRKSPANFHSAEKIIELNSRANIVCSRKTDTFYVYLVVRHFFFFLELIVSLKLQAWDLISKPKTRSISTLSYYYGLDEESGPYF
jgi:hypothetical protein